MAVKNIKIKINNNSIRQFSDIFILQWKRIVSAQQKAAKHQQIDDIHNLRTGLRRFILSLKIYELLTERKVSKFLQQHIQRQESKLGKLRNIDESILFARKCFPGKINGELCIKLTANRNASLKEIKFDIKLIKGGDKKYIDKMQGNLNAISISRKNEARIQKNLQRLYKICAQRVADNSSVICKRKRSKARHKTRIALRELRYLLEVLMPMRQDSDRVTIKQLHQYQTALGRINDIAVFRKLFNKLEISGPALAYINDYMDDEESWLLALLSKKVLSAKKGLLQV